MNRESTIQIHDLAIELIVEDELQPRKDFTNIFELRESIKREGLIYPLEVERMSDGKYLLLDGARRLRALRELSILKVSCIVKENVKERLLRQLVTDFHKEKLNPVERAESINRLIEQGYLKTEVASLLGISSSSIARDLNILRFNPRTKTLIVQGVLKKSAWDELVKVKDLSNEDLVVDRIISEKSQDQEAVQRIISEEMDAKYIVNQFLTDIHYFSKKMEAFRTRIPYVNTYLGTANKTDAKERIQRFTDKTDDMISTMNVYTLAKERLITVNEELKDDAKTLS